MKTRTDIMRVDKEFKLFTKSFADKNKIKLPEATRIFTQQLKTIRGSVRREDILF